MQIRFNNGQVLEIYGFIDRVYIGDADGTEDILYFNVLNSLSKAELLEIMTEENLSNITVIPIFGEEVVYTDKTLRSIDFRFSETSVERSVTLK